MTLTHTMPTRPLGTTGLNVSLICLGTMTWGQQNTEADAHAQLNLAVHEGGVNFIDTAEMYPVPVSAESQGRTEAYLGSWLAQGQNREKVVVATKVAGPSGRLHWLRDGQLRLDRKNIVAALDASLKRLQTDFVDLYQLHWPDRDVNNFGQLGYQHNFEESPIPLEDTLEVLQDLVQAGKIRFIGVSNETPWGVMTLLKLAQQHGWPRIHSIQNPYSLLNRSFEVGLSEVAIREQVGLLAYSPLGFGVLTGKYFADDNAPGRLTQWPDYFRRYADTVAVDAAREYVRIARDAGWSPTQLALAFVNQQPFVTSNIIGATTLAQLRENLASATLTLPADVLAAVDQVHQRYSNPAP